MEQQAFIGLVNPFKDRLFRVAKRLLVSTEEAEDAVQEVMAKLWGKRELIQSYGSPEAYAMTLTKNFCLDQLKSKRASNMRIVHNEYKEREAGLQQQLEDRNSLEWINRIVNHLPEQQKLILQLREVEELEYDEIAKIMDMNEGAVRTALSRARKIIRETMKKTHDYGTV